MNKMLIKTEGGLAEPLPLTDLQRWLIYLKIKTAIEIVLLLIVIGVLLWKMPYVMRAINIVLSRCV